MKKIWWIIIVVITVIPTLLLAQQILASDPTVKIPVDPNSVVRTELYAQYAFFPFEGGIMRIEPDGRITAEHGDNNWLSLVHVQKMYVVSERRGFIVLEGIYRDTEWFVLTALDIHGHIDFGRFITADGYDVSYVPNAPYVGDFYFTNKEGKKLKVNVRGDLFGPVQEVEEK